MKTHHLVLSATMFVLLASFGGAASPAASEKKATGADQSEKAAANPALSLKKAMPAADVRAIMGQPLEIKSMPAPNGKAEIWIYRREINDRVERMEVGSVPITTTTYGADGKPHVQTVGENIQYANVHKYTEEIVELLMFNDHFLVHKISQRDLKRYE